MHWNNGFRTLLLVNHAIFCLTTNTTDEERLYKKLFENYNRASRPVIHASDTVYVEFYVSLIQIMKLRGYSGEYSPLRLLDPRLAHRVIFIPFFCISRHAITRFQDAENQVLHTHVWLTQAWKDERLHWNSDDFDGVKIFPIPSDTLWLPDVILFNSVNNFNAVKMQGNAVVQNGGSVTWIQSLILQSSCDMDIRYFPFDEQTCTLKFASWSYHGFQVDFIMTITDGIDITEYLPNNEWILTDFKARRNELKYRCCEEPYVDIQVQFTIQRMPLYYFYSIIIPCMWLTILNLLVFLLPLDNGDKVSLGVTIFLAYSVFMLVIAEKVPVTSEHVPLIGSYLTVIMGMTSLSLIMTIFILNIHHVGPNRKGVPRWLQILTHGFLSRVLCLKPSTNPFQRLNTKTAINRHDNDIEDGRETKDGVTTLLNIWVEKQVSEERQHNVIEEWRFVASVLDRLLFWLFLIGNVTYSILYLKTPIRG